MVRSKPLYNRHHTQFYRSMHECMPDLQHIRQDHRLIVPMDLDAHSELHKEVIMVPPLSHFIAQGALRLFEDMYDAYDPVTNLQNYMDAIERAAEAPHICEMEKSVAELAVWACEKQIPYIQDGYIDLSQFRAA